MKRKVSRKPVKQSPEDRRARILASLVRMDDLVKQKREIDRQIGLLRQQENEIVEAYEKYTVSLRELHEEEMKSQGNSKYHLGAYQMPDGRIANVTDNRIEFTTVTPLVA